MIYITHVALRSRSVHAVVLTTVAMWTVAAATGRRSLEIDLSAFWPPTKLPVVELCTILGATLLAVLTRPRFWEWDRISARRRPRVVAAVTAAAGIVLPALCVPAVVPWLPAGTAWAWVLADAVIMSATVQVVAPLLSPLAAGGVALLGWLGCGLVMNLAPDVWVPLSTYRDPEGNWTLAAVLVVAAVASHTRTCGKTGWAHRRFSKEQ